jgi:dihydroorotate dehydrogenase electron transfer subunit
MIAKGRVIENSQIAESIYKMVLEFNDNLDSINCGQFINVSTNNSANLLKRPFGIIEYTKNIVTFCYQIKGEGTLNLSKVKISEMLDCVLPLGNGFNVPDNAKNIALIGGGIGVFPLISVINKYKDKNITAYFGYKNKNCICFGGNIDNIQNIVLSTDDGSCGVKGNSVQCFVTDKNKNFDLILACGPLVMLKALKQLLKENNIKIKTYVSLEERMGCGIGACLVCTCKKSDGNNARVCKDGPVFDIWEVEL